MIGGPLPHQEKGAVQSLNPKGGEPPAVVVRKPISHGLTDRLAWVGGSTPILVDGTQDTSPGKTAATTLAVCGDETTGVVYSEGFWC
ncbi:hypothetical protein C5Y96_17750 [Blastopirellula marina]|uniref:Uncharacterized protein n=1 Tax=Blastopirellula marina TaxID=124 RepID=A0A2S8F5E6_9BACT|nr:hypothetical protein C5Y96_17750 [Blastopirellula marina]RCS47922.1 hypothetical protein DTL36_17775 [Bremerella cremea]